MPIIKSDQTLTRVSISRKSRREITYIFLSRSREMKFHFSFSSRFSRFSRFLENISLSLLDFWADEEIFLVLLSIYEIPVHISLSPLVRNAKFRRENFNLQGNSKAGFWAKKAGLKQKIKVIWYFGEIPTEEDHL